MSDVTQKQVHDGLAKAKARIDTPEKWCQLKVTDHDNAVCLGAALGIAAGVSGTDNDAFHGGVDDVLCIAMKSELAKAFSVADDGYHGVVCGINNANNHGALMAGLDRAIAATAE